MVDYMHFLLRTLHFVRRTFFFYLWFVHAFTPAFRCWDLIDSKTTEVIHSEVFLELSAQLFSDIVKRNTLCVEEIDLYERAIEWAQTQLRK